ncbi:uncharacterized protein B0H18DRAFT_1022520 [Fomitopsis serialis]|uniref:uncharacterized protein n=1 Tax=Fomitopsis serialis TaxID=139415 RepID=UPI0020087E08|nr:uncharacterized protein B0H18DRAFT_1022520 [Neoantrodia serialis]KAH9921052.1 hypothetical protein B0H18DRAFT_1022520 [Neoantrodia serialis]
MSYNREWDKGKQPSADGPWQYHGSHGGMHPRDDEYFGDGKRRKFNNGGYDASQGYDQGYDDGAHDLGHGQGYVQDYAAEDRFQRGGGGGGGGGGYSKKRLVPSEPSPHVIFLGLDPDFTEADLQAYLSSNSCSVETVTIIRDRTTGLSKGFGFAQFTSIAHARAFVDPLFPFIQVPPPASHGASAAKAFYTALEAGVPAPPGGRRVKIDYSQSASPNERRGRGPMQSNEGMRDIGNTQAPVLLFRGLDPLSGPQAIAQAMKNAAGPGKDGAKGMRRIILIKDKVTMASWGFAFVEFVDVQSASTVLGLTMSPQIHPNGFRISDRPVAASFAHPESFQPISDYALKDESCMMSSLALGGVEEQWVRYWDEGSMAAVLEFEVAEPIQPSTTAPAKDKKEKKRAKGDGQAHLDRPAAASTLPVSDKPVTLSLKGGLTNKAGGPSALSLAPAKKAPVSLAFSAHEDGAPGDGDDSDEEQQKAASDDPKVFAAKKVAPLIASKKVANNITKWNQVQEVLHDAAPPAAPEQGPSATASASTSVVKPVAKAATPVPVEADYEFSDTTKMTCLLCARQFKTLEQLKRHNNESDLHKKNFKDASLRDIAREKVAAIRSNTEQPKYRDRASERRVMHNQPDVPLPGEVTNKAVGKRKHAEGPPKPPTPPPAPVEPAKDQNNVGNKLLKMMGWKEGTGLGTDGEGRVDPIQTAIYAQGVGLGASKGKEVGKYDSGYAGYVHMAQDAARERYGS